MKFKFITLLVCAALSLGVTNDAFAATKKHTTQAKSAKAKKAIYSKKRSNRPAVQYAALVVDTDSGRVLFEKNAEATRYPASLTKMMTLYLTFDALKHGDLDLDQRLTASEKASQQPQTNIALDEGDQITVRTAIESLVVRSANDAAMVLGEKLGRTEFNFALMMTQKARELGMKSTVFRNPSGLPDPKQYTTAMDMAKLGIALRRDFPEYYHYFKLTSFEHNGITYPGHNRVMERYPGVDGIKTGYIRASGYNLVTSAERDGHRIVAVIMGGTSGSSRDKQMVSLLNRTFEQLRGRGTASDKGAANDNSSMTLHDSDRKFRPNNS